MVTFPIEDARRRADLSWRTFRYQGAGACLTCAHRATQHASTRTGLHGSTYCAAPSVLRCTAVLDAREIRR